MSFAEESELAKKLSVLSGGDGISAGLEKPMIVYGTGRSGSTIFHTLLCRHPEVAWLSGLCQRFPTRPSYNRLLMQALDTPMIGSLVQRRFKPFENYPFWEHYCRGFTEPFRDLRADDLTVRSKVGLRDALAQTVSSKRSRLLAKITGWPRFGLIQELWPDAKFIHVVRDGRAVANSIMNVGFWRGWMGPENWRWGPLPPDYEEEFLASGKSFAVLAAIQWKILLDAVEAAREKINPANYIQIKYEDFCENTGNIMREVLEFCELENSEAFNSFIAAQKLTAANYKWKEGLTQKQQDQIEECLNEQLTKYGYSGE